MHIFRGISQVWLRGGKALQGSFSAAASYFYSGSDPIREKIRHGFFSAVKVLLTRNDGTVPRSTENTFCALLEEFNSELNTAKEWRELIAAQEISPEDFSEILKLMAPEEREQSIRFLLTLAVSSGAELEKFVFLEKAVSGCGMDMTHYETLCKEISGAIGRRERILRSGTGVIAALIVLVVFILTATLLRSVIFGLIFAYLLLPLEKYMERNCREKHGPGHWLGLLASPCKLFALRKKKKNLSFHEKRNKYQEHLITRAVGQTAFVLFTVIMLFLAGLTYITSFYLQGVGASIRSWKIEQQNQHPGESLPAVRIRQIREKLMAVPAAKFVLEHLEAELASKEAQKKLITMVLQRSGGVVSSVFGILGTISTLIFDLLLTFFFGLLFLMKLAAYKGSGRTVGREYAVRTILNGKWLPGVQESTVKEAERIVGGVFDRLRIWVRGYLTLMFIDSTVYTILFCMIGVPYFPVFGIIAGCGILLPYIGPIASCLLTLTATWFGGGGGAVQLLLVLCCYLLYSGVVEQFILYPAVIGESLGLTTLETIVVVLLGAVFAGIPGMILALPAASVLKYIVPQIYRCWDFKRGTSE